MEPHQFSCHSCKAAMLLFYLPNFNNICCQSKHLNCWFLTRIFSVSLTYFPLLNKPPAPHYAITSNIFLHKRRKCVRIKTSFLAHVQVISSFYFFIQLVLFFVCLFSRAVPPAYGGSQARSGIGATAASLYYSHSNMVSEPHLWPTPQLMAMLDP